jgi:DNA end-binding protein Ku
MAPRSIWNGTVSFGLINVPVKVFSATESKTVHFSEVHVKDEARIEHRRFCTKEDKEVDYDEVVRGFEVAKNEYVVLEKDEVTAAAGDLSHVIEVDAFVCVEDIDPVYFDRSYYLGAGDKGDEPYTLLHTALKKTGRAALGRFTFHNREYLAAIRPLDGVLALHTMHFEDELVTPSTEVRFEAPGKGPSKREIEMASKLISSLEQDFRPGAYKDQYREAVLELIERKAKGEEIEPVEEEEPESSEDLAAALEASLA